MTGTEALDLVMLRLGSRTDATLRAACLLEMKLLQTRLEGSPVKPWFLFGRYATPDGGATFFQLSVGGGSLTLPANFLDLDEDECAVYLFDPDTGLTTSLSNVVARLPRSTILNMELSLENPSEQSLPKVYQVIGQRIYFRPLADKAYIVQVPGYWGDDVISDTSAENDWLKWAPDVMVSGTTYHAATKHTRDTDIAMIAKSDFDEAYGRLKIDSEARKHTGMRYVMGGYDR